MNSISEGFPHQMSSTLAAIFGGAAGAVALVGIAILIWFCLSRQRNVSRTSETGSSDPSQGKILHAFVRYTYTCILLLKTDANEFHCMQWEDMVQLSCLYEIPGVLRWKNYHWPQKVSVTKIWLEKGNLGRFTRVYFKMGCL